MMHHMDVGHSGDKQVLLGELLSLGMVLVALDARREGVDVPRHLADDAQLRLNLSYRFGLPMAIDDWGVKASLTFGGVPHTCRFPWHSLFLLVSHVNGEPYFFPDDMPHELLQKSGTPFGWRLRETMPPNMPRRAQLTLVTGTAQGEPMRATMTPRGRKKAGARRASGGFAALARRIDQEQSRMESAGRSASDDANNLGDGHKQGAAATSDAEGAVAAEVADGAEINKRDGRLWGHLRVVK